MQKICAKNISKNFGTFGKIEIIGEHLKMLLIHMPEKKIFDKLLEKFSRIVTV